MYELFFEKYFKHIKKYNTFLVLLKDLLKNKYETAKKAHNFFI